MPVTFINCFDVPAGEDERFLQLWRRVNDHARGKPGYLGHALHRSLSGVARNRYVNVAVWASREDFAAATDDEFHAMLADPAWARFPSTPNLYEVIDRDG